MRCGRLDRAFALPLPPVIKPPPRRNVAEKHTICPPSSQCISLASRSAIRPGRHSRLAPSDSFASMTLSRQDSNCSMLQHI